MEEVPADLLMALPEAGVPVVQQWWLSLTDADRRRIAGLWDERLEICFFAPQADVSGRIDEWEQIPAVRGGRFVPGDDDGRAEWQPGYFEHLLQHPELVLAYEPVRRTFHIGCTRHRAARACLAAGEVPPDFACPAGAVQCPLVQLRGARLSIAHRAEPAATGDCGDRD